VTLDYNGELFATTEAFPAAGPADADAWKYVCNVQQVQVSSLPALASLASLHLREGLQVSSLTGFTPLHLYGCLEVTHTRGGGVVVQVERTMHFCHNLLHTCGAFLRTAGTGGLHWQCVAATYEVWQHSAACGGRAALPAEALSGLAGATHWGDNAKVAGAGFSSFVDAASRRGSGGGSGAAEDPLVTYEEYAAPLDLEQGE
jgi:hypothetical protein